MDEFKKNKQFLNDFYYNLINIYKDNFNNIKPSIKLDNFNKNEKRTILKSFIEKYCINDIDYINYLIENRTIFESTSYYSGKCLSIYKNESIILINPKNTLYDIQVLIHELGHAIDKKTIESSKELFKYLSLSDYVEYNSRYLEKKFIDFLKESNINCEILEHNFNSITYRYFMIMYVYTLLPNNCFDEYGNVMFDIRDIKKLSLDNNILNYFITSFNKCYCGNVHDMNKYAIVSFLVNYESNELIKKINKKSIFNEETFNKVLAYKK